MMKTTLLKKAISFVRYGKLAHFHKRFRLVEVVEEDVII